MSASAWVFDLLALLAIAGALGMVLNLRNAVAGALSLVLTMIALGGIYVLLDAYLVGAIQVIVYAGAIVVLFLFVVMLLNLRGESYPPPRIRRLKVLTAVLALLTLALALPALAPALPAVRAIGPGFGGYLELGRALFRDYLLPFEVTSLLLLAAMVGAVVLAKRRLD